MRQLLKIALSKSRILRPFKSLHQNKIVIFNYHRIKSLNTRTPFDEGVFGPDSTRLQSELEWINKETRVLSEEELIDIVYKKKKIKEICSLVTFDDGYRDNFDIAYPMLKNLGIPAIFFIPTYHLTERKVGWWDIVAYLIKEFQKCPTAKRFIFEGVEYRDLRADQLIKYFIGQIKSMNASEINGYLIRLSETLNIPFPDSQLQSDELMNCEQIKILSQNGMTIGSHSHDHSILSKQDGSTLKKQLEKSIEILERVISKKINSIAYPVGGYQHFDETTKNISKDVGFKLGFSYLTGVNNTTHIDPFDVKRMSIRPEWINLDIPLAFPEIFLKNKCQA